MVSSYKTAEGQTVYVVKTPTGSVSGTQSEFSSPKTVSGSSGYSYTGQQTTTPNSTSPSTTIPSTPTPPATIKPTINKNDSYAKQVNDYLAQQAGTYGQVGVPSTKLVTALNAAQNQRKYFFTDTGKEADLSGQQRAALQLSSYFEKGKGNYGEIGKAQIGNYYGSLGLQTPKVAGLGRDVSQSTAPPRLERPSATGETTQGIDFNRINTLIAQGRERQKELATGVIGIVSPAIESFLKPSPLFGLRPIGKLGEYAGTVIEEKGLRSNNKAVQILAGFTGQATRTVVSEEGIVFGKGFSAFESILGTLGGVGEKLTADTVKYISVGTKGLFGGYVVEKTAEKYKEDIARGVNPNLAIGRAGFGFTMAAAPIAFDKYLQSDLGIRAPPFAKITEAGVKGFEPIKPIETRSISNIAELTQRGVGKGFDASLGATKSEVVVIGKGKVTGEPFAMTFVGAKDITPAVTNENVLAGIIRGRSEPAFISRLSEPFISKLIPESERPSITSLSKFKVSLGEGTLPGEIGKGEFKGYSRTKFKTGRSIRENIIGSINIFSKQAPEEFAELGLRRYATLTEGLTSKRPMTKSVFPSAEDIIRANTRKARSGSFLTQELFSVKEGERERLLSGSIGRVIQTDINQGRQFKEFINPERRKPQVISGMASQREQIIVDQTQFIESIQKSTKFTTESKAFESATERISKQLSESKKPQVSRSFTDILPKSILGVGLAQTGRSSTKSTQVFGLPQMNLLGQPTKQTQEQFTTPLQIQSPIQTQIQKQITGTPPTPLIFQPPIPTSDIPPPIIPLLGLPRPIDFSGRGRKESGIGRLFGKYTPNIRGLYGEKIEKAPKSFFTGSEVRGVSPELGKLLGFKIPKAMTGGRKKRR